MGLHPKNGRFNPLFFRLKNRRMILKNRPLLSRAITPGVEWDVVYVGRFLCWNVMGIWWWFKGICMGFWWWWFNVASMGLHWDVIWCNGVPANVANNTGDIMGHYTLHCQQKKGEILQPDGDPVNTWWPSAMGVSPIQNVYGLSDCQQKWRSVPIIMGLKWDIQTKTMILLVCLKMVDLPSKKFMLV